jgi:osmotically inducible lipoprotein OsmB
MKKYTYPLLAIALGSSVACTNMSGEQQGTLTGAGIGAVAGAGIAAIAGGSGWTGAAVGAVAGGVVGNIKGREADQR